MLAHIHVGKTGGKTICEILRKSFPGAHCDLQAHTTDSTVELQWTRRLYPRLKSIAGHFVRPYGEFDGFFSPIRYFTFLRDPIQRCASHYQFSVTRNGLQMPPFPEWIRMHGANHQIQYFCPAGGAEAAIEALESKVQFVGLLERFDESLVLWHRWADNKQLNIRYRSRNIATDNRIKDELLADPKTREMLLEYNQEDERLYRYARDVIYPRQLKQFGCPSPGEVAAATVLPDHIARPEQIMARCKRNLIYKPLARSLGRESRRAA